MLKEAKEQAAMERALEHAKGAEERARERKEARDEREVLRAQERSETAKERAQVRDEKVLEKDVDEAIKERALNWKARYGVEVRLDRNITWQRPYVPAEDAMFGWTGNVSSTPWEHGNRLVFTPPASPGMNKA